MKRFLPIVSVIFLLLIVQLLNYSITFSRDSNQAHREYLGQFSRYRESYSQYSTAKNEYQSYQTLTAQTKFQEATRALLGAREETLRTYLVALRLKFQETVGVINYSQNMIYLKLDLEIQWLTSYQESLSSATTIEELRSLSQEFENRYPKSEVLIYQSLGTILATKLHSQREKVSQQTQKMEEKIAEMKKEGEEVTKLETWLVQAKKKISASAETQNEAENILREIKETQSDKRSLYLRSHPIFTQAHQDLQESLGYLLEMIEEIKYEE